MVFSFLLAIVFYGNVSAAEPPIDFDTQIIPVLSKNGCNSGACHGAAAGRGGFHLSLFGSDPTQDYHSITHALEGRRLNHSKPEQSLILRKALGELEHGGGEVVDANSLSYQRLLKWIQSGSKRYGGERSQSRKLISFEVALGDALLQLAGQATDIKAIAVFDDGEREDVFEWTIFLPQDTSAVQVDRKNRTLSVSRPGQHIIIARFLDQVIPVQIIVPFAIVESSESKIPSPQNLIDIPINRMIELMGISAAPLASDAKFLRRVSLDLTGRLPSSDETQRFLSDDADTKRESLVDELLRSKQFVDYWTFQLARMLRAHAVNEDPIAFKRFSDWLRSQIEEDVPWNEMTYQLLTSTGDSHVNGPANFHRLSADARGEAELVAQVFMGVRIGCANCHSHPLDRWTQDDYHGLAAVYAKLDRGRIVKVGTRGTVTNPRTQEDASPRIPGERNIADSKDPRTEFADWLVAKDNPYFARSMVNRFWSHMFGRGLVDPVDDLRESNPASHPELLNELAIEWKRQGYRLRPILREIALSHTYGRSFEETSDFSERSKFFAIASKRPLSPEVLLDAIADATGVPSHFPGHPPGTRAVELLNMLETAGDLETLGRCNRLGMCDETSKRDLQLTASLSFVNGELINQRISNPDGILQKRIAEGRTNREILRELALRTNSILLENKQLDRWEAEFQGADAKERKRMLEDFFWSLLSSHHFRINQ